MRTLIRVLGVAAVLALTGTDASSFNFEFNTTRGGVGFSKVTYTYAVKKSDVKGKLVFDSRKVDVFLSALVTSTGVDMTLQGSVEGNEFFGFGALIPSDPMKDTETRVKGRYKSGDDPDTEARAKNLADAAATFNTINGGLSPQIMAKTPVALTDGTFVVDSVKAKVGVKTKQSDGMDSGTATFLLSLKGRVQGGELDGKPAKARLKVKAKKVQAPTCK